MKKHFYFIVYIISIVLILYSVYSINSSVNLPIETKTLYASFEVSSITGFDTNKSALTFGALTSGSSSVRTINLENNHNFPIEVVFVPSKNIDNLINFNRSRQEIGINETKSFSIILTAPKEQLFGKYEGNFSALIYRKLN